MGVRTVDAHLGLRQRAGAETGGEVRVTTVGAHLDLRHRAGAQTGREVGRCLEAVSCGRCFTSSLAGGPALPAAAWSGPGSSKAGLLLLLLLLFVGCLTSQQRASVSQERICSEKFTCCHTEVEVADQTSPSHSVLTPGRPVPDADPITPGRTATGVSMFKSLI